MDKKQTVFLSAILGIGSIMMLSFLIISATKAKPDCVVSDDLTVTGKTVLGDDSTDKVTVHGVLDALESLVVAKDLYVRGDSELGYNSTNKVKAYKYCDENGNNCHDASYGWLKCHTIYSTCDNNSCNVDCDTGIMTGGGCNFIGDTSSITENSPKLDGNGNGWHCGTADTMTIIAYVRCCE